MFRPFLAIVVMALAGCSSHPDNSPRVGADPTPAVEPVHQVWQGEYNLSLFGSWHTPLVAGHVFAELGYYNCIILHTGGVTLERISAEATWTSHNSLEERAAVFHSLKNDNEPFFDVRYDVGTSPLNHSVDLAASNGTQYVFIGVQTPPDMPAGFGTVEAVLLRVALDYEGEKAPSFGVTSTCGQELN